MLLNTSLEHWGVVSLTLFKCEPGPRRWSCRLVTSDGFEVEEEACSPDAALEEAVVELKAARAG